MKNKILIGLVVFLIVGVIGFNINMNLKSSSKTSGLTFSRLQLLAFGEHCDIDDGGDDGGNVGEWDGEWGVSIKKCFHVVLPVVPSIKNCKKEDTQEEYTTVMFLHTESCISSENGDKSECKYGCYLTGEDCGTKYNGSSNELQTKTCGY